MLQLRHRRGGEKVSHENNNVGLSKQLLTVFFTYNLLALARVL